MKTITVNNKEYIKVSGVGVGKCTGCAFAEASCLHVECNAGDNKVYEEVRKVAKKPKPKNKVSFYRYHRPIDHKTGHAKSDQGVTFFVKINYKKRTMRVSCSVCNGDNFSKVSGKFVASLRYDEKRYLEFSLNEYVSSQESVLDYLRITLDDECHLTEFEAAVKQLRRMCAK